MIPNHPKYDIQVLKDLEKFYQVPAGHDRKIFKHLHPNYISSMCPFRVHFQTEWSLDDFILLEKLNEGSFGRIVLSKHKYSNWHCATKLVSKSNLLDKNELAHLFQEIKIHLELGYHPNIALFYGCFDIKNTDDYALILEWVNGPSLVEYIHDKSDLSFVEFRSIFCQILMAVQFFHDNRIIHRDLKSDNILILPESGEIKIIDFGFSIYFHQHCSWMLGTYYYMAPEIIHVSNQSGRLQYNYSIDVWACGILMYELLTGDVPWRFNEKSLTQFSESLYSRVKSNKRHPNPNIPHFDRLIPVHFRCILARLLRTDPDQRISLRQILEDPILFSNIQCEYSSFISDVSEGSFINNLKDIRSKSVTISGDKEMQNHTVLPFEYSKKINNPEFPLQGMVFCYQILRVERENFEDFNRINTRKRWNKEVTYMIKCS